MSAFFDPSDPGSTHLKVSKHTASKTQQEICLRLGRLGHSAKYSQTDNSIYVFGGQQEREGGAGTVRDFQNDLWKLCLSTGKYDRVMISHMAQVARRIYTTSFMISQYFFAIGGLSINGECLDDILMLDTVQKKCSTIVRETNKSMKHLRKLCSSACVPAFYASRYDETGVNLSLEKVS